MATGDELYAVVEEYANLGEHRSGTEVDTATVDWFAQHLTDLGATTSFVPYGFDRFDVRWEVAVDGEPIPSMPLFYEWEGTVTTDRPRAVKVPVIAGTVVPAFDELVPAMHTDGVDAAVIATDVHGGFLCAVNRTPTPKAKSGLPTVCIAGSRLEQVQEGRTSVHLDGQIVPGRSANVVGHIGDGPDEHRVLLATPMSGWFRCAGERGTGIAVCLAVARELAERGPVTVLGTNGHELSGQGVHHHLRNASVAEKAILHFGASVGSGNSDGVDPPSARTPGLMPSAWAGSGRRDELRRALAPLGVEVRLPDDDQAASPDGWVGESRAWSALRRPLVSIAGWFPLHHAPEDVPHLATSPELLQSAYSAAVAAAHILQETPSRTG
jgi:hypothetical protein